MRLPIRRILATLGVAVTAAGITAAVPEAAMADPTTSFVPFHQFISDVQRTNYTKQAAVGRIGVARDATSFADMRSYVLRMYQGVVVKRSYVDAENSYFDCVTVDSQPSRRGARDRMLAVPQPPAGPDTAAPGSSPNTMSAWQDTSGVDRYGNPKRCAAGTIPMQRISLERLTSFATVKDFQAKGPNGAGRVPGTSPGVLTDPSDPNFEKRYAHGAQSVINIGGSSIQSLWEVNSYFSISQQWYSANASSRCCVQTVEGGTVDYHPNGIGTQAVLFIYFTADGYQSTGCYNLTCPGFVQVNNNWSFGSPFAAYSVPGGTQIELKMLWKYIFGNWWLYLYRGTTADAVGYYPGYIYGSGPLANGNAARVDYGGEVNYNEFPNGAAHWGPMGSGDYPLNNPNASAYHRNIFYIQPDSTSVWTVLQAETTSIISCYNFRYFTAATGGSWGSHLYFGGPGSSFGNQNC